MLRYVARNPLSILSALALGLAACGGSATGETNPTFMVGAAGTAATLPATGLTPASPAANGGSGALPTGSTPISNAPSSVGEAPVAGAQSPFCTTLGVVRNKCQSCHGAQRMYGAPMSLVTYDDFQKPAVTDPSKKVYQMVSARIHDMTRPMPPINQPTLAATELSSIDSWIAGGALAGADPTCASLPAAPPPTTMPATGAATAPPNTTPDEDGFPWPNDCEKHYKLLIYSGTQGGGQKMTVAAGQEAHPQITLTPPWKGDVQGLAFKPITDNAKILHHWILYAPDGTFIMGWAPGSTGSQQLPADVGIYLPSTGNMRLDVHYNNLGGTTTEMDASGLEVCTIETPSKFRKNVASIEGIVGNATVPAHQQVDNTSSCMVTTSMGSATVLDNSPHMHKYGTHAKLVVTQGGKDMMLHDAPFSFEDQRSYPFNPGLVVKSGDKFTITCSYNNTSDRTVTFGENTEDEMCFNFILVYPRGGFSCGAGVGAFPGFGGN
jgi:Copper type II ascorbate-dependent monooxygenase, C-terminal domain